jgi:hypothetical protein
MGKDWARTRNGNERKQRQKKIRNKMFLPCHITRISACAGMFMRLRYTFEHEKMGSKDAEVVFLIPLTLTLSRMGEGIFGGVTEHLVSVEFIFLDPPHPNPLPDGGGNFWRAQE